MGTNYYCYEKNHRHKHIGKQSCRWRFLFHSYFIVIVCKQSDFRASGGILTNKYAEGYPGKRYFGIIKFNWYYISFKDFFNGGCCV